MSSADIFITPTHNACCLPSAIIAYKLLLRKTGFFLNYLRKAKATRRQLSKKLQHPVLNFYPFSNSRALALNDKQNNAQCAAFLTKSRCGEQSMYL